MPNVRTKFLANGVPTKKKKLLLFASLILIIGLAIAYLSASAQNSNPHARTQIDVSWEAYQTLGSLKSNASSIIVGQVVSVKETISIESVPYTDFVVSVTQSIKGSLAPASSVIVRQLGNSTLSVEGEHLLNVGDKVILFLTASPVSAVMYIVGGPQGHFTLQNGEVNSLDATYPDDSWIHVKFHNLALSDFIQEVNLS